MTTTQRKPLSAAHKAKISRALTKNKQKKEKKEGGFFTTIARIRKENAGYREKQKDWDSHMKSVDGDQIVGIAKKYNDKRGDLVGKRYTQKDVDGLVKTLNRPANMAKVYGYKSGKAFEQSRDTRNKAKGKLESRSFLARFL